MEESRVKLQRERIAKMADIEEILKKVETYFVEYPHPDARIGLLIDGEEMGMAEVKIIEERLKEKGYGILHFPVLNYSDEEIRIKGAHIHKMMVITREGVYS